MAVFLFSLIGLPLTAGFVGKLLLFVGAFTAPTDTPAMRNLYQILAVVAAVNAAIGAYYYLRVVGVMYLRTPLRPLPGRGPVPTLLAAVVLAAQRCSSASIPTARQGRPQGRARSRRYRSRYRPSLN